ncbi:Uncharacterised protein [Cedecea neteri]|uniref:Uncharacterized protein n=1 Tax=Cedecea neteri TaxID=158822 RepID=A0A291E618_9ENTR|nr:hypothetical protein [Cedecea neteri]ATF95491.1 hypothetical protein CO704_25815 [Cedecea neteri]SQC92074.1 Uncharacterised protein [Cedecea neteri]
MSHDRPVLSLKRKTVTPETGDTSSVMPTRRTVILAAGPEAAYLRYPRQPVPGVHMVALPG